MSYTEAIVTVCTTEPDDISRAEMDSRISAGEPIEHAVTKVYRIEFTSEDDFLDWLGEAERFSVNTEQLTAQTRQANTYSD